MRNRKNAYSPQKSFGFSLVEMTVVLLVLAVISSMGISVFREKDYTRKTEETRSRLVAIENALMNYRNSNQRLPCPANGAIADGALNYGLEGKYPGSCTDGAADGLPVSYFENGNTVAGVVPTRTLQLPDDLMLDGWGRRITYAVDRRMTHVQATFKYGMRDETIGSIRINDASGAARTEKAVYALISHGENGHGAFLSSGERRNFRSVNTDEHENASYDADGVIPFDSTLVMRREVRDAGSLFNRYDDILRYKERWAMVDAVDILMASREPEEEETTPVAGCASGLPPVSPTSIQIRRVGTGAVLYTHNTTKPTHGEQLGEAILAAIAGGEDLEYANLKDACLYAADLEGVDLEGADLTNVNLDKANLKDADLRGATLAGAKLSETDLREADLRDGVLTGVDLRTAKLHMADLRDGELSNTLLSGADLRDVDLRDAVLVNADLTGAVATGADMESADLRNALLVNAVLQGVDLAEADFRHADLSGANLANADLEDARFNPANLSGANLCGADTDGANFSGANLTGASCAP